MGGAAENRAGSVVHQDKIRDVNGQLMGRVERMPDADAGIVPQLLGGLDGFFGGAALAAFCAEGRNVSVLPLQQL